VTTDVDLTTAVCPTCGRIIPEPLDVDPNGRVECPSPRGHRVSVEEVVAR